MRFSVIFTNKKIQRTNKDKGRGATTRLFWLDYVKSQKCIITRGSVHFRSHVLLFVKIRLTIGRYNNARAVCPLFLNDGTGLVIAFKVSPQGGRIITG